LFEKIYLCNTKDAYLKNNVLHEKHSDVVAAL